MTMLFFMLFLGDAPRLKFAYPVEPRRPMVVGLPSVSQWLESKYDKWDERDMLRDAQRVLLYAGDQTGSPPWEEGFRSGPRFRDGLTRGWHSFDVPRFSDSLDQMWLQQPARRRDSSDERHVVVVFDERDFPLGGLTDMAEKKAEELRFEGVKKVIVLQRGEQRILVPGEFRLAPPETEFPYWMLGVSGRQRFREEFALPCSDCPIQNTMVICWIGDAELSLVFSRDFGREGWN